MKKSQKRKLMLACSVLLLILFGYLEFNILTAKIENLKVDLKDNENLKYNQSQSQENKIEDDENADEVDFSLTAKGAALLDASSNHVLYEKNGNEELAMASTTKIMTCIVALEYGDLDDVVTFSKKAAGMPDVQLNAKAGEKFTLRDLLYSLMLESHNDTAVAIAEHIGGSVEGFAKLMNKKAQELGLTHTNFVTPNGLDAEGHYTTACELALIASYAIKNEQFLAITNEPDWTFQEIETKKSYSVQNKNRFLSLMDGACGVKTGFTNNAGYCFVGAIKRDGKTLISVVLGAGWPPHKTYKWKDTQLLMNYGLDHFSYVDVLEEKRELYDIPVDNGQKNKISITMEQGSENVLLKNSDKVRTEYVLPDYVQAPVKKGEIIGYARYYINDTLHKEVPITSQTSVREIDYEFCEQRVLQLFFSFT